MDESYQKNKNHFHHYINTIKMNNICDIYTVLNSTLIKNPFLSEFPKEFFHQSFKKSKIANKILIFFTSSLYFYAKNFYKLYIYGINFLLYKKNYRAKQVDYNNRILVDTFLLINEVNKNGNYADPYFASLYPLLEKRNFEYTLLPRLYGASKNPFKLIKLFKILNKSNKSFLFEFEFLTFSDFFLLFILLLQYPFKTLRLLQKERTLLDHTFNKCLLLDIKNASLDEFTRFVFGKNISKINEISKIYSWGELQAIERGFNYGIRTNSDSIIIIACQFFLKTEAEFNLYINDQEHSSPHKVLVNGTYYLSKNEHIDYNPGVALRYPKVFTFDNTKIKINTLVLGSYYLLETKNLLVNVQKLKNILFKPHPAVNNNLLDSFFDTITLTEEALYTLFETAKIVIGTASGSLLEAVACGIPVIVVASNNSITINPLVYYGKGKIWDIAYTEEEIPLLHEKLIDYKDENECEIIKISNWYRESFFIEPTEENIVKAFELDKE
jgi:hypothetical protein